MNRKNIIIRNDTLYILSKICNKYKDDELLDRLKEEGFYISVTGSESEQGLCTIQDNGISEIKIFIKVLESNGNSFYAVI